MAKGYVRSGKNVVLERTATREDIIRAYRNVPQGGRVIVPAGAQGKVNKLKQEGKIPGRTRYNRKK